MEEGYRYYGAPEDYADEGIGYQLLQNAIEIIVIFAIVAVLLCLFISATLWIGGNPTSV